MNKELSKYFIGITWFIFSLFSSSLNDIISKYTGSNLHSYEITFFRFLFGAITLIPFIIYFGKKHLVTSRPIIHLVRGLLLFFAIAAWTHAIKFVPVTTATVISFTVPVFTLILGIFFLNENIIWQRWLATIVCFSGIIITSKITTVDFNYSVLFLLFGTMCFASLDILNKKFVIKESMLSMIFYSAIIVTIASFPFAMMYWSTPTLFELFLLFILGSSANLILFFLLKSFALVDATAVAPYRYLELLVSGLSAYIVFQETIEKSTLYGAMIIIPSMLFIIYSEKKFISNKVKNITKVKKTDKILPT